MYRREPLDAGWRLYTTIDDIDQISIGNMFLLVRHFDEAAVRGFQLVGTQFMPKLA